MRKPPLDLAGVLLALLLLAVTAGVAAQAGDGTAGTSPAAAAAAGYDLAWWTVDGGGATWSAGGGTALGGAAGQPDAGVALIGGDYTLVGGFWGGAARRGIYLPLVLRSGQ